MKFGFILAGVTVLTLILIFGFYKIFLQKNSPGTGSLNLVTENANRNKQAPQSLPVASVAPSGNPSSSASISPSIKPKASTFKSTIGTITVLQNNTTSSLNSSGTGSSVISGTISFSGTAPTDTSLVIVARANGSSESYKTVASGITAANSSTWSWGTAESGKAYDMVAVLKGSSGGVDTDYATSQTYVVTAPALNQIFSINSASTPDAPGGEITTTCSSKNANNVWTATVNFPSVSGTLSYKLQVGTTSEGYDVINTSQGSSSSDPSVSANLTDSILYYAQFAVANSANPTEVQYSAFSTPQSVKCP